MTFPGRRTERRRRPPVSAHAPAVHTTPAPSVGFRARAGGAHDAGFVYRVPALAGERGAARMAPNASSSKEQTAKGAKVTTVATSSAASDGGVPSTLTLEVPKGGKAGFLWADKGGGVSKITAGGLADKSGVKVGWRLAKVVMTDVTGATLGKQVGGLIAAAQKTGKPFKLTFEPPASSFSSPSSATPAAAASSASSAPAATPEDEDAAAKKAAEEEEAARKAAEAEVERLAAEEAARVEAERKKAAGNGVVKMLYNMYDEEFEIKVRVAVVRSCERRCAPRARQGTAQHDAHSLSLARPSSCRAPRHRGSLPCSPILPLFHMPPPSSSRAARAATRRIAMAARDGSNVACRDARRPTDGARRLARLRMGRRRPRTSTSSTASRT